MNAVDEIKSSVMRSFLDRCAGALGVGANMIRVYTNPTEEIHEAAKTGKAIKLFGRGPNMLASAGTGARARLEENYLYDTRNFASGAQSAGDNLFFTNAIGLPAANNGFPVAGTVMTDAETNMDVPSQIAQGKDYVLTQIGLSFNAGIATADAVQLLDNSALRFSKQGGQFTLKHGPMVLWPGGTGFSAATTTANLSGSNGIPDIRAVRRLAVPRVLRSKDTFNYNLAITRTTQNLDMSTAISFSARILVRLWLWGGQQDAIPV